MIPRDYRAIGQAMGENLKTMIENHPDAFDILLYRPDASGPEHVADEADVVGTIEGSQLTQTYADPVEGKALKLPDGIPYEATDDGDAADGFTVDPAVLLINHPDVPKHSVIQYEEYNTLSDRRLVSVYVSRSELLGQAPGAGHKHFCIPFPQFMLRADADE